MVQSRNTATSSSDVGAHPRSARRSRKGCPECRRRKIKCDESQPRCGQCQKGGRKCRILDSVFKQHAFTVEQNGANHTTQADRPDVNDSVLFIGANSEDSPTSRVRRGRTVIASPPGLDAYAQTVLLPSDVPINNFPVETTTTRDTANQPAAENSTVGHSILNSTEVQDILLEVDSSRNLETLESTIPERNCVPGDSTIDSFKDSQEELFLLRHYSECIAPWMDLLYRYEVFSRETLTLARDHPILRYAACAVAAKQLGQMRIPVSDVLRGKTQKMIALKFTQSRLGFLWYSAKYYERAIQTLVKSITPKDNQSTQNLHNHVSPSVSLSQGDLMVQAEGEDPIVRLLGTCILIQYEHLSATGNAWAGHLTGFSKLLDLIDDGKLLEPNSMFSQVYPFTKDIMELKAGFWNFVVNDFEESFVSHRRTRIDTENLSLWRNMGLVIEDDGRLTTSFSSNSLSATPEHARDKILSYTLIRLVCKLVDYLAPILNPDPLLPHGGPTSVGDTNAEYIYLENQFDSWIQILSPSFHPDGSFLTRHDERGTSKLFGRELWFSNDLCATTMMYYHMARMLLLIHRPSLLLFGSISQGERTPFDLLYTYRIIERQLHLHASEVIAIIQGTLCDAVKLRAIQPLYVAGRCCTDTADRHLLVGMFRDIQDSLGIATEYRVKTLLQEWDLPYEALGIEERPMAESP
ncbi:hypothetical protein BGW36DRAFT_422708 [Talaromyces proteolyticus]|uniref:Zn(2)-C6 fungal-type domain-containing protein n=1 Tax=Talaromyces proteolyticus TaxID=1131652 RepID=A0AAD4L259_9EURO|nr:uncharacterized protein BGW36DRAFT_422708 [Talaromyces proteolyticus]KAH8703134.1 hypothetical protein BGW36DRAFT_422708 [Talaromyces proteolyticus]